MLGHNEWGTFEASVVNKFSAEEITPVSKISLHQDRFSGQPNMVGYYTNPSDPKPIQFQYKPTFSETRYEIPVWGCTRHCIPANHDDYDPSKHQGKWFGWDWESNLGFCKCEISSKYWENPVDGADGEGNPGWTQEAKVYAIQQRKFQPWLNWEIHQIKYAEIKDTPCKRDECVWTVIVETKLFEITSEGSEELFSDSRQTIMSSVGYWENNPRVVNDLVGDGSMITPYGNWEVHSLDGVLEFAETLAKERNAQKEEDLMPVDPEVEPVIIEEEEEEEEEEPVVVEEEETIIIYKPPPCGTPAGGPCAEPSKLPFILGLIGLVGATYIVTKGD